jgi:hypothetical protein
MHDDESYLTEHGARGYTSRQYAVAVRHVVTPTALREVVRGVQAIFKDAEQDSDRLKAAEWLMVHSKGRPGVAAPAVDPLELPKVTDAASALAAYQALTDAVSKGECCADSAAVYRQLIGDAAKIALADVAVGLLAAGGNADFMLSDDVPFEEQLPALIAFYQGQLAIRQAATAYAQGPAESAAPDEPSEPAAAENEET